MNKPAFSALVRMTCLYLAAFPLFVWANPTEQLPGGPLAAASPADDEHAPENESTNMAEDGADRSVTPRRPLAIVRRFNPLVQVRHLADEDWIGAARTHPLHDADTLRTGDEGFAVVQFMDNSVARVRPNSLLIVHGESRAPGNTAARIAVELGEMFLSVQSSASAYEIATPSAVAAVRGTRFSTWVSPTGASSFTGFSGHVLITALASGNVVPLVRGTRAEVDAAGEEIELTRVTEDELDTAYDEYQRMDDELDIKSLWLRFIDAEGRTEEIELEYFQVQPDEEE